MSTSAVQNRYMAMRYFREIMTDGNLAALYELIAPDFVFTLPTHPEPYYGPDGFKDLVTMLHSAFLDLYINPVDMIASGDTVVTRWRGGGTHLGGPILTVSGDIPASGRQFEIDGVSWMRIMNNKIVEVRGNEDTVGMFAQLGIGPSSLTAVPPEQNLMAARRYFDEVMNQGKLGVLNEIVAPDLQLIVPSQPVRSGQGEAAGYATYLRNAFPDIKFTVEREIASDNKVAVRWNVTGTHLGEFLGLAPTGSQFSEYGVNIFTFEKEKIKAIHVNQNDFGLLQQLQTR